MALKLPPTSESTVSVRLKIRQSLMEEASKQAANHGHGLSAEEVLAYNLESLMGESKRARKARKEA